MNFLTYQLPYLVQDDNEVTLSGSILLDDIGITGELSAGRVVSIEGAIAFDDIGIAGNLVVGRAATVEGAIAFDDIGIAGELTLARVVNVEGAIAFDDIGISGVLDVVEPIEVSGSMLLDDIGIAGEIQVSTPSGGSGLYTLPTTTGLQLWFNAQNGVTTDANGVTQWDDNSGTNRHATRAINNHQLVPAALNGLDIIDGNNAVFNFPVTGAISTWSIIIVAQVDNDTFLLGDTTNYQIRVKRSNQQTMSYYNGIDYFNSIPVAPSNWAIYEWVVNGGNLKMFQNGAAIADRAISVINTRWSRIGQTVGVTLNDAKYADIIAYTTVISDADRETIRNTLAARYNITLSTP